MSYDNWLQAPYMREGPSGPLVCTECREHVFDDCEDRLDEVHCTDADTGEVLGRLEVDADWDWANCDPSIP